MVKKIYILFFLQIFLLNLKNVCADDKIKVINNLNNIETLKFNFIQETFDKNEKGVCFMMRPHFLKCNYEDKIQKELIINRNNLVIYHRRYNKSYYYPVSKSFFTDILNKEKFKNMILNGNFFSNANVLELKYFEENKGEITILFDEANYNITGWTVSDLNGNITKFKISDIFRNIDLDKKIFLVPTTN